MMLCLVAACATESGPASPFVPGLGSDGSRSSTNRANGPKPCRIDKTYTARTWSGPLDPIHQATRISYDAAGRSVLDVEVDTDRNEELWRYVYEYDAMGNWTHQLSTFSYDDVVFDQWMAYDALGRRVRDERDADGEVDMVATFGYGDHDRAISSHVVWPSSPRDSYDGVYQYDAHDRLTQVDLDAGFNGSIDRSERYTYDDDARTAAMDRIGVDGQVQQHTDFTYDDDGHVILQVETSGTVDDGWKTTFTKEYDAGALVHYTRDDLQLEPHGQTSESMEDNRVIYDCD